LSYESDSYVSKDQAETSVLFELISARYERRSTLITANQPFGAMVRVNAIPDPVAARAPTFPLNGRSM
jgi:DNA replication protein DnaC